MGWSEFCKEFLATELLKAWENLVELLDLNYIDMRAEDTKNLFRKQLRWEDMYRISEDSALGSNDAMILNLLDSSIFPLVMTSDFDLAYGVSVSISR
jgi:hypothetical protein